MLALSAALAAMPAALAAQTCQIPERLPQPRPIRPDPAAMRVMPVTDYLLVASWSPQYCRTRGGRADRLQCGSRPGFGFVLHGLWPEGEGRSWPQYCRPVGAVPAAVARRAFCTMPSVSLQQHEWAKHGSCMTTSPDAYFAAATRLFGALRWPDMDRLSRARTDVAGFTAELARLNRGVRPDAIRLILSRGGWLEEVRLCLDRRYRPMRCPADTPGARSREQVRIWRQQG